MAKQKWDDLSNIIPFKNETAFDYEKWDDAGYTRITLTSVPWDSEYRNVVAWESDEKRDEYFEQLEGYVLKEETEWNFKSLEVFKPGLGKHVGKIDIDLPYESAVNYSYLMIEMFEQPVPGGDNNRREVYFYFLPSLNKLAPNTTELFLELDTWTTYCNSIKIEALNLYKGHYPHALTPADEYLSNPLDNNLGVTDFEPDLPSLTPLISHQDFVSFSKNDPRICIAMTGNLRDRRSWYTVLPTDEFPNPDDNPLPAETVSSPTTQNTRWNSNNWDSDSNEWNKAEAYSDKGNKVSVAQQVNGKGTPQNLKVYSMTPSDFNAFINYARNNKQTIIKSIKAVYVLDSQLLNEGVEFAAFGYSFKEVSQSSDPKLLKKIELNKEMFDYEADEADYAKLYSGQFAKIEISNLQGVKAEVSIEEISETIDVYARTSAMFPFLKLEALLDGIGGSGIKEYAVKPLNSVQMKSFQSQWEDFVFDFDIPVYSVYIAKDQELGQDDKQARDQKVRSAKVNKKYSDDQAQANYDNSMARSILAQSMGINKNSVKKEVDTRTAGVVQNNARDQIDIASENNIRSFTLERNNSLKIIDLNYSNSVRSFTNSTENAKEMALEQLRAEQNNIGAQFAASNDSVETDYLNTIDIAKFSLDYWNQYEKPIRNELIIDTLDKNNWFFQAVWDERKEFFKTSRAITNASTQITTLSSAATAAYGIIGSGISSIPAAAVGVGVASYMADTSSGKTASSTSSISSSLPSAYNHLKPAMDAGSKTSNSKANLKAMGAAVGSSVGAFSLGAVSGAASIGLAALNNKAIYDAIAEASYAQYILASGNVNLEGENDGMGEGAEMYYEVEAGFPGFTVTGSASYVGPSLKASEFFHNMNVDGYSILQTAEMMSLNYHYDVQLRNPLEQGTYDLVTDNALRSKDTTLSNISNTTRVQTEGLEAIYDQSINALTDTFNVDSINASGIKTISTENTNEIYSVAAQNNLTEYTTLQFNNDRTYSNTIFSINRWKEVNDHWITTTYNYDKIINDRNLAIAKTGNANEFGLSRGEWAADYLTAVQAEPSNYGSDGGSAWIDQFGQRGLEIRVKRCSKSVAKKAAMQFKRYGYTVDSLFIEDPELSLMTNFTYWKADSVWITGDKINETNKELIRTMFEHGVTVWTAPELIFKISGNNIKE